MKNPATTVLDVRVVCGAGGGPDKTILNSPRFLQSAGYRMCCAYLHSLDDPGFNHLMTSAQLLKAPLLSVSDRGPLDWRVIPTLLKICKQENVRIWHGHDYKSNVLGLLLRRLWPMRLVTTVHGWVQHTSRTRLYYQIDRLCLPYYDAVFCVSPDLHEECMLNHVPSNRCVLLENAIDIEQHTRHLAKADAKRSLGFDTGRCLIGAVGRLSAEKGFDVLIRAIHLLVRQGADVGLVIVGEGREMETLAKLIKALGLSDRVRLAGYTSQTARYYEAMDLFALSSLREGLPNVLLEAMAIGVPVVATRVGGIASLIEHGTNGLLVEPNEPTPLAEALALLLKETHLQTQLARAARQTIEQRYGFAQRMTKLANVYDFLLKSKRQADLSHISDVYTRDASPLDGIRNQSWLLRQR